MNSTKCANISKHYFYNENSNYSKVNAKKKYYEKLQKIYKINIHNHG